METSETLISLFVMACIILFVANCRQMANWSSRRSLSCYSFFLELTGTFQICACTHELSLLGDLVPKPQVALFLTYIFSVVHGWTLTGSVANPASSFQQFYKGRLGVQSWCLQTSAQFAAAILAHICMKLIWMLGMTSGHSTALPESCINPIQTTVANAFGLEFLFSFLLHLTLLQFESMDRRIKVHLIALLITSFVYTAWLLARIIASVDIRSVLTSGSDTIRIAFDWNWYSGWRRGLLPMFVMLLSVCASIVGSYILNAAIFPLTKSGGNVTGAIFNPALAFSLHIRCFMDQFWNYVAVYWIAPCIGSTLVTVIWDEVLPGLYREI